MNRRIASYFLCMLLALQLAATDTSLAAAKPTANIANTTDRSKGMNRAFSVSTAGVDGKIIINAWNLRRGVNVSPGAHHFILKGMFGRGFYRSHGVAMIEVTGSVVAGGRYKVVGKVKGEYMSLWIEEVKSGKRITNVGSMKYYLCFQHVSNPC